MTWIVVRRPLLVAYHRDLERERRGSLPVWMRRTEKPSGQSGARKLLIEMPCADCRIKRNIKWLADYCGTSIAMIEKHYWKYIQSDIDEPCPRFRVQTETLAGASC